MMYKRTIIFGLLVMVLLLGVGCDQINIPRVAVGETRTDSQTVELGAAEKARVNIDMGVGELIVNGGSANLMDADFTYNVDDWEPEVEYTVNGNEGRLTVQQPPTQVEGIPDNNIEYTWDIQLNDTMPTNLDLKLGVGKSELNLGDLNLTNLSVQTGVGDATIDLTGNWTESFNTTIQGGLGRTTVYLPDSDTIGLRVDTSTGLGSIDVYGLIRNGDTYTNAAFNTAETILDIDVQGGVGAIRLEVGR